MFATVHYGPGAWTPTRTRRREAQRCADHEQPVYAILSHVSLSQRDNRLHQKYIEPGGLIRSLREEAPADVGEQGAAVDPSANSKTRRRYSTL